jgi:hypothetical protein
MIRAIAVAVALLTLTAAPAAAVCEIHPAATKQFIASVNDALYQVRSVAHLAQIIAVLQVIDRDVLEHEMAHFNAAEGWAEPPEYDYITLYDKNYRIGGCVRAKPGIPLDLAYRAALAPRQPSDHDYREAGRILELIRLSKRRR